MSKAIVSIYTYHLKTGTRLADFMAASQAIQAFLEQQNGFQYRSIARQIDNPSVWVDLVYWRDGAALQMADTAFMESPACRDYMDLIDQSTVLNRKCEIEQATGAASAA